MINIEKKKKNTRQQNTQFHSDQIPIPPETD